MRAQSAAAELCPAMRLRASSLSRSISND